MDSIEIQHEHPPIHLAGGVSTAWNALPHRDPVVAAAAYGDRFLDTEGKEFADFNMGHGSLLLGHNPSIFNDDLFRGGTLHPYETHAHRELADRICTYMPGIETVRLACSGTEATLAAIRLARVYTGRQGVLKFEGHFHGVHDTVLYNVDSSPYLGTMSGNGLIEPVAGSGGLSSTGAQDLFIASYNDLEAVEDILNHHGNSIACIIVEPIALNIGCVKPLPGFLEGLRKLATQFGVVLIFDEVMTGFRVALDGAQGMYGIVPDLTCLSKALGCGMPIAAFGGRRDIMEHLAPSGQALMAGTSFGRGFMVQGALRALDELAQQGMYEQLSIMTDRLAHGLRTIAERHGAPAVVDHVPGCIAMYWGLTTSPLSLREIAAGWNRTYHNTFFRSAMEEHGLYWFFAPSENYPERIVLSMAHTRETVDLAIAAADEILTAHPYA